MGIRTRKFIGAITLLLFLCAYALVAMAFGASQITGGSRFAEMVYFFVAGLAWVLPAGILIRWMQRPDSSGS